ncbi:hypothetical protein Tco_0634279, partial [Tanacetum coccineum]
MVVEILDATRADDGGVVIDVAAGNTNGPNVMKPTMRVINSPVNKLEKQKTVVKVATLTNKQKVLGAHVIIP